MTRRAARMVVLVVAAVVAGGLWLSVPEAHAKSAPKLRAVDYGAVTRQYYTTPEFRVGGTYGWVDVVDAITVARRPGYPCRSFTLQLFRAGTGHQVGATRRFPCRSGRPFGEAHWETRYAGSYFVLVTVSRPRAGERYATAGTIVHGVAR